MNGRTAIAWRTESFAAITMPLKKTQQRAHPFELVVNVQRPGAPGANEGPGDSLGGGLLDNLTLFTPGL